MPHSGTTPKLYFPVNKLQIPFLLISNNNEETTPRNDKKPHQKVICEVSREVHTIKIRDHR